MTDGEFEPPIPIRPDDEWGVCLTSSVDLVSTEPVVLRFPRVRYFVTKCSKIENKTREGVKRGGTRRERKKRERGMKDRVDKSRGIMTLIVEDLAKFLGLFQ